MPPIDRRWIVRWSTVFERVGARLWPGFAGVTIVEARKELMGRSRRWQSPPGAAAWRRRKERSSAAPSGGVRRCERGPLAADGARSPSGSARARVPGTVPRTRMHGRGRFSSLAVDRGHIDRCPQLPARALQQAQRGVQTTTLSNSTANLTLPPARTSAASASASHLPVRCTSMSSLRLLSLVLAA